ncbi:adenylyltransferase/cytidyltransferase family protein [Spartinivicinus poritis]|uniref:nicotinate-nucleotide adenylyltransferase n=1 Tax=Spartinivicinus poritis TaxID=2994640 RepID=A0ABT5UAX8_9GAMM|nr:adenylyltransferase/cytidyltransferase family protein [Spartinivicinus sp. A2-2]MDE1463335.1 adenylyltransferase/cytidyltransferase family protein [Spartinivicinus sp. A2-2]
MDHKTKHIGVFGSAFNPPTQGHASVIEQAATDFDQILLVPSAAHAFDKEMLDFAERVTLLEKFILQFTNLSCQLSICSIEMEMLKQQPDKPVFTYDLLNKLDEKYQASSQSVQLSFILGPDNMAPETWQKFYRADEIKQRWVLYPVQEKRTVRSTKVRSLLAAGADKSELAGLLSPEVTDYIFETGLYQSLQAQ